MAGLQIMTTTINRDDPLTACVFAYVRIDSVDLSFHQGGRVISTTGMSHDEAERYARAILASVKAARRGIPVSAPIAFSRNE